ncbi:MAG: hypothetical protein QM586_14170 [Xenophilus sp.]
MEALVIGYTLGVLFWAGVNAVAYADGERVERHLRIQRARLRDHAGVPPIKG